MVAALARTRSAQEGMAIAMNDEVGKKATGGESPTWKILVVDDEEVVRNLAAACIQHGLGEGHQLPHDSQNRFRIYPNCYQMVTKHHDCG